MHLVFATSLVPDRRPASGYDIANAAILRGLQECGVDVSLIGYCWPGEAKTIDPRHIFLGERDPRTDAASATRKLAWLAQALSSGQTFASAKLRIAPPAQLRQRLEALGPIDGYVVNSVQLAGAYPELFVDRPSLFIAHNVEHLSARQNAGAAHSAFEAFLYRREARHLEELESRLVRRASSVLTLAEDDLRPLGLERSAKGQMLPLVTRAGIDPALECDRTIQYDAAMIGTWSWAPNRIGLDWFLREVVPHLPADFTVRIAGSTPRDVACDHPGVQFVGRVADAGDFIRAAGAVALAAQAGTGVQLKTIETFELGLPAAATSSSLRGIAALPANVAVADEPAAFAAALVERSRNGQRVSGRDFHRHQHRALVETLSHALEGLAGMQDRLSA